MDSDLVLASSLQVKLHYRISKRLIYSIRSLFAPEEDARLNRIVPGDGFLPLLCALDRFSCRLPVIEIRILAGNHFH